MVQCSFVKERVSTIWYSYRGPLVDGYSVSSNFMLLSWEVAHTWFLIHILTLGFRLNSRSMHQEMLGLDIRMTRIGVSQSLRVCLRHSYSTCIHWIIAQSPAHRSSWYINQSHVTDSRWFFFTPYLGFEFAQIFACIYLFRSGKRLSGSPTGSLTRECTVFGGARVRGRDDSE